MAIPFILPNVKPSVVKLQRELAYFFPELTHFYGYAGTPDHNTKRCLDAMVYDSSGKYVGQQGRTNLPYSQRIALGDRVLAFLRENANRYHLNGVIWNRHVYGFPGAGQTGNYRGPFNTARPYKLTAHDDHLHIDQDGRDFESLIPDVPFIWDGASFPGAARFGEGVTGPWITYLGQRLVVHGYKGYEVGPGPEWGAADRAGVQWAQEQQGFTGADADGIPGAQTWAWLAADPVVAPPVVKPPMVTPPDVVEPPVVKPYPAPATNDVYLDRMQSGVTNSDTAWYVRAALKKVGVKVDLAGDYPTEEVKAYQRDVLKDDPRYCDGILGPSQATRLFADAKMPVRIYRSSSTGGLVNPDPKAPSVPVKAFVVPMREWGGNAGRTLIQGLRIHEPSGTRVVNQADAVRGQRRQDIVWRCHDKTNGYLGAVWAKDVGHGSTTDLESTGPTTFNLWFRNEATRQTGYIPAKVGQTGPTTAFKAVTALPYGDPAIDQDADLICIRYGNRYRGYRLSAAKDGQTVKLWDFTIPRWGVRFQGHLIHDGHLYVHRDIATKGSSMAHEFNYAGKQTDSLSTKGMGDEAEGFVVVGGHVCVVKRTGGNNASRVIQITPWK